MAKNIQPTEKSPKLIVGLDIGTTKILMVMGYLRDDGKIEVCGYGKGPSTGVEYGLVFNLQETIDDISIALNQLLNSIDEPVDEVYVGVAGRHIKSIACTNSVTRPDGLDNMVAQEEVAKMLSDMLCMKVKGSEVITVIPQYYEADERKTTRPRGTLCQKLVGHYQLVTGDTEDVKRICLSVSGARLTSKKLILEPIASGEVCLTEAEKKNGVALIDIGGGTTDLVIFHQGVPVFIKVIPVGGEVITNDIASLNLTKEQAESLKINHGNCIPADTKPDNFITIPDGTGYGQPLKISETNLSQVISARVSEDILKPVRRAIEESGYDKYVRNVVVTGGGAGLRNMPQLCEFILNKNTRIGYPTEGISGTTDSALRHTTCSTALGLLRLGCLEEGQHAAPSNTDMKEESPKGPAKKGPENPEKKTRKMGEFIDSITDWFGKFISMPSDGVN